MLSRSVKRFVCISFLGLSIGLFIDLLFVGNQSAFAQSDPEIKDTETLTELGEPDELEEIVIEEEGEPEAALPLGTAISGETLRTAPGSAGDPLRTLQSLPGLTYTDDTAAEPSVRGSRPGDNYFQADFAPTEYLFHLGGLISIFNADLVESFDVYPSAFGPEFIGNHGGVFDIQLRDPQSDKLHGSVDIGLLQTGALIEGPISEDTSFYFASRFSYLDIFLADQIPETDGVKIEEFPNYSDYQGKLVWEPDNGSKVVLQISGAADDAQVNVADDAEGVDTEPVLAGQTLLDTSFHEQALRWELPLNDRINVRSLISHNRTSQRGKFGGAGEFDIDSDEYLLKSHASYTLTDSHELSFGAEIQNEMVDLDLSLALPSCGELDPDCILTGAERLETSKEFTYNEVSGFIKDNWYVNDRLTLFPGLAYLQENLLDESLIEPRFALEYIVNDDTIISGGLGLHGQSPQYLEIDDVFGNPSLEYIDTFQAQIGVQRFFSNGWSVKSEAYYKSLDNLVISDDELRYTNEAEGQAFGLDTLIRKDLTHKFSGWASISLSEVTRTDKRTNDEFVFSFDQPVNIALVGKYKFNHKWSIGAKLWAHSGAPYTPVIGANEDPNIPGFFRPVYGELNSERFSTFSRLDIRVDRAFVFKRFKMGAYFELLNALQKENEGGFDYNFDYTEREVTPQLTGFFSFGLKASF